jgi:hypothetical protein
MNDLVVLLRILRVLREGRRIWVVVDDGGGVKVL